MTATIFDIERNSFVDGPGIRTTVFFKGCNLTCAWCHNPESQSGKKEILFYKNKCTACGRCRGLTVEDSDFVCYADAKEICGRDYTLPQIMAEVVKDRLFYENSGGGVTCSGGECMLQIDFLQAFLQALKKEKIHTAVDTAGHVPFSYFQKIMPFTDLFLFDIKTMDKQKHMQYIGAENTRILENLAYLLQAHVPVWVRMPIVPGVNDNREEMLAVKRFFQQNDYPQKVELLPYHALGEHKYDALQKTAPVFSAPSKEETEEFKKLILE